MWEKENATEKLGDVMQNSKAAKLHKIKEFRLRNNSSNF